MKKKLISIDDEVLKELRILAAKQSVSVNKYIRNLLAWHIDFVKTHNKDNYTQ